LARKYGERETTAVLELWQRAENPANILARFDGITNKICLYSTQHTGLWCEIYLKLALKLRARE
jgi:hypothetical protein